MFGFHYDGNYGFMNAKMELEIPEKDK